MIFGYCRISTKGQSFDLQEDALKNAGCECVFKDVASGAKTKRPGLDDLLGQLRAGDI
jgi:DNA invertase Pin-like site-specific DNA recombinase